MRAAENGLSQALAALLGACLALAPGCLAAAGKPLQVVHAGTAHDALFALRLAGERGVASGDHGLVLLSSDGGASWQPAASGVDAALLGVDLRTDGRGLAVGQHGAILYSEDGGRRWSPAEGTGAARLFAAHLAQDGHGLAVGEFGALLRTRDHGRSWQALAPRWSRLVAGGDAPHLYDVLLTRAGVWLVAGEFGVVLRSEDNGEQWQSIALGDESLFKLRETSAGALWTMGQGGALARSRDGGRSWQRRDVDTLRTELLDLRIAPDGRGVLLAFGKLRFTTDGGESWHARAALALPVPWCQEIALTSDDGYLLGCAGALVLRGRLPPADG